MKKYILYFLPLFLAIAAVRGFTQNTFNKQYYFNGVAAIGNGIHVTDSCYYVSSLVADTINGYVYDGLEFSRLNLEGELINSIKHLDTISDYENWRTPLMYNDSHFTSVGYGTDSTYYLYWLRMDNEGEIIHELKHRSPNGSNVSFIQPHDVEYDVFTKKYIIVSQIASYSPSEVLNTQSYVMCLDSTGQEIWNYNYGESWAEDPLSSAQLPDRSFVIGISLNDNNLTFDDMIYKSHLLGLSQEGEVLWTWTSQDDARQGPNDIVAEGDGSMVIADARGYLQYVNVANDVILWDRGLIFKLDEDRQVEWETEFYWGGSNFTNRFTRIVKSLDESGYVAAGTVAHPYDPGPGGRLGYLAKVSATGDSLWSRRLLYYESTDSIEYDHRIYDLKATPDGGYLMSGNTLDRGLELPPPIQRAWFIKVDSEGCVVPNCGLVDAVEPDEEGPALLLYPNPATTALHVYLGDSGNATWVFQILDMQGRPLARYDAPVGHTTYTLPVGNYPAGNYILQVLDEAGRSLKSYQWVKGR